MCRIRIKGAGQASARERGVSAKSLKDKLSNHKEVARCAIEDK